MGPTILFTHLKIILLQCFQFSVFSNNKLNPNGPYMLNCDKSCVIVCVPSIFFILLLDRNGFSLLCGFELELSYIYGV